MKFLFENSRKTGYCGRYGVHAGVSDELWQITHDDQYSEIIKPALETCHEVTCVGFSLGGSLCNIFTMCANMGENNLDRADGEGEDSERLYSIPIHYFYFNDELICSLRSTPEMYDDYNSLAWTKAVSIDEEDETWRK
jgi:hypothetical protein